MHAEIFRSELSCYLQLNSNGPAIYMYMYSSIYIMHAWIYVNKANRAKCQVLAIIESVRRAYVPLEYHFFKC